MRGERESSPQSASAAQIAWQRWAAVPRKARTVLKQADPENVAILELSYLQFIEDVRLPAMLLLCFVWHGHHCCKADDDPKLVLLLLTDVIKLCLPRFITGAPGCAGRRDRTDSDTSGCIPTTDCAWPGVS